MARQPWSPTSGAARRGAQRLEARSQDPSSGLGASARATQREHRQAAEAMAPFASRERARTLPPPKTLEQHRAEWQARGAQVLAGQLAALPGVGSALYLLVRHVPDGEPVWWLCGTGLVVEEAELEGWGGEWRERYPLGESAWAR
jgi:hypothetical protein